MFRERFAARLARGDSLELGADCLVVRRAGKAVFEAGRSPGSPGVLMPFSAATPL
jgi:hypothetical protein